MDGQNISGVGIEGYYIAGFDCNAPFKVLYCWTFFKRMELTHEAHMNEAHASPPVNGSSEVWKALQQYGIQKMTGIYIS